MSLALAEARKAWAAGEVPVGAVVVRRVANHGESGRVVLAAAHNQPITQSDPTAHAELVALRGAAAALGNYRLPDCEVFVTLEPCAMCATALIHARVKRVVFGAADPKTGACGGNVDLRNASFNHQTVFEGGVLADDCGQLLKDFFAVRRRAGPAAREP